MVYLLTPPSFSISFSFDSNSPYTTLASSSHEAVADKRNDDDSFEDVTRNWSWLLIERPLAQVLKAGIEKKDGDEEGTSAST